MERIIKKGTPSAKKDIHAAQAVCDFVEKYSSHLLVLTTLVTAVTLAPAFAVPGGYASDGPGRGTTFLVGRTALRVFLVVPTTTTQQRNP